MLDTEPTFSSKFLLNLYSIDGENFNIQPDVSTLDQWWNFPLHFQITYMNASMEVDPHLTRGLYIKMDWDADPPAGFYSILSFIFLQTSGIKTPKLAHSMTLRT